MVDRRSFFKGLFALPFFKFGAGGDSPSSFTAKLITPGVVNGEGANLTFISEMCYTAYVNQKEDNMDSRKDHKFVVEGGDKLEVKQVPGIVVPLPPTTPVPLPSPDPILPPFPSPIPTGGPAITVEYYYASL